MRSAHRTPVPSQRPESCSDELASGIRDRAVRGRTARNPLTRFKRVFAACAARTKRWTCLGRKSPTRCRGLCPWTTRQPTFCARSARYEHPNRRTKAGYEPCVRARHDRRSSPASSALRMCVRWLGKDVRCAERTLRRLHTRSAPCRTARARQRLSSWLLLLWRDKEEVTRARSARNASKAMDGNPQPKDSPPG